MLITNDDTLSPDDAAQAYKAVLMIERCFRTMKSVQVEVRPMFHRLDRRIVGHVKTCVLALLLTRMAELRTGRSWGRVRHALRSLQAVEFRTDSYRFTRRSELRGEVRSLLEMLEIEPPKLVVATEPLVRAPERT